MFQEIVVSVVGGVILAGILLAIKRIKVVYQEGIVRKSRLKSSNSTHLDYPTFDFDFEKIKKVLNKLPYEERGVYLWYLRGEYSTAAKEYGKNPRMGSVEEDTLRFVMIKKKLDALDRVLADSPARDVNL
jgi:hypothetical protein